MSMLLTALVWVISPRERLEVFRRLQVTAKDLLTVPQGEITERGLSSNIDMGIQYMAPGWAATVRPLYNLMEDAATRGNFPGADMAMDPSSQRRLGGWTKVTPELTTGSSKGKWPTCGRRSERSGLPPGSTSGGESY